MNGNSGVHRLAEGVDPAIVSSAENAAGKAHHAHLREGMAAGHQQQGWPDISYLPGVGEVMRATAA